VVVAVAELTGYFGHSKLLSIAKTLSLGDAGQSTPPAIPESVVQKILAIPDTVTVAALSCFSVCDSHCTNVCVFLSLDGQTDTEGQTDADT
jgi:hypothetical protein